MSEAKKYLIHYRAFNSTIWRFAIKGTSNKRYFNTIDEAVDYAKTCFPSCCYNVQILDDTYKIVFLLPMNGGSI